MRSLSAPLTFGLSGNLLRLFYTIFLWELGFGLYINNMLTVYLKDHGMTEARTGLVLTIAGLARITLLLPVGSLMDHVGRKPVVVAAAAIAIPGSFGYIVASNQWILAIATIVMSVNALGFPAMSAIIAASDLENPTDTFRLLYTVGPAIAFIIGPAVGGLVGQVISNRAVFLVCAFVFLAALLLALGLEEPHMHNRGMRRGGYLDIVQYRPMRLIVLFGFGLVFILSFGVTFLPNLITDAYHFSDQQRGIAFSFGAIGTLILSMLMSRIKAITAIRGSALGVLSVSGICIVALTVGSPWILIPAFAMRGGFMFGWSLLTPVANEIAPPALRERTFASIEFATGIGNTIAPVLAGIAYEIDRTLPFLIGAIVMPIVAVLGMMLDRRVIAPEIARKERIAVADAEMAAV
jgi:MFS family permease